MKTPQDDLELILVEMPPEMQRRALRLLDEWGVAPRGNTFTTNLTLITRLQNYTLAQSVRLLTKERAQIEDLLLNMRMLIHRDAEAREPVPAKIHQEVDRLKDLFEHEFQLRQSYLKNLRAAEWGEALKIQTAAQQIESYLENCLERLGRLLRDCPDPGNLAELLRKTQQQSLEAGRAVADLSRATDQMLHAAARMDAVAGELQKAQAQQHPLPPPPPTPPSATQQKERAPFWVMLTLASGFALLIQWPSPSLGVHLLTSVGAAFCLTIFVILALVLIPDGACAPQITVKKGTAPAASSSVE